MRTLICLIINQANQNPRNVSSQSIRDSGDSLLTLLQELVIFLSFNKQLTEYQHHGMSLGNQDSHKTKVCDKSWKENYETLKLESKVVQDPIGYALVSTVTTL